MTYALELTPEDVSAIDWVGDRYGWSEALRTVMGKGFQDGTLFLEEHEAWEFISACDGDDSFLPCLNPNSDLAGKIFHLIDSVV